MRIFKDRQEALDNIDDYVKKNFNKNKTSFSDMSLIIRDSIFSLLNDSADELVKKLKGFSESGIYMFERFNLYCGNEMYFYYGKRLLVTAEGIERAFFVVGNEKIHIIDLAQKISIDDLEKIVEGPMKLPVFFMELVYEYAVFKRRLNLAKLVLNKLTDAKNEYTGKEEIVDLSINSSIMADYWPLLVSPSIMKRVSRSDIKTTMENYLKAVSSKNQDFGIDHALNEEILKKIGKKLKSTHTTIYNDSEDSKIDKFDLLESNPASREDFLNLRDWNHRRELRKLRDRNQSRLHEIIVNHLNNEHRNGIRRSKFLRTYSKLKEEIEIDVFRLNTKLQSYILLEEIS